MNWKEHGGWYAAGLMAVVAAFMGGVLFGQSHANQGLPGNSLFKAMARPVGVSPMGVGDPIGLTDIREASPVPPINTLTPAPRPIPTSALAPTYSPARAPGAGPAVGASTAQPITPPAVTPISMPTVLSAPS